MTDSTPSSVLIVGGAHSGKTVYAGQLYGRLAAGGARVRLRQQPDDLSLFAEGYEQLSAGLPPEHTTLTARDDVTLALIDSGEHAFDVVYPDYGGEQVDDMIDRRLVPDEWAARIRSSATWLFFIRLDHQSDPPDVVSSPPGPPLSPSPEPEISSSSVDAPVNGVENSLETEVETVQRLADQARTVEALQLLLHVYGASTVRPITTPPLVVVLSCWDEVGADDDARPPDVLKSRLPLVAAFVRANWQPEAVAVFGLSAQGKAFEDGQPDDDFIDRGPESMGYVVLPDGSRDADLTVLLVEALMRVGVADE